MTENRTFKLIEAVLGEPVIDYLRRQREDERSWDWIRRDLEKRVGVTYSREWLRRYYTSVSEGQAA